MDNAFSFRFIALTYKLEYFPNANFVEFKIVYCKGGSSKYRSNIIRNSKLTVADLRGGGTPGAHPPCPHPSDHIFSRFHAVFGEYFNKFVSRHALTWGLVPPLWENPGSATDNYIQIMLNDKNGDKLAIFESLFLLVERKFLNLNTLIDLVASEWRTH